LLIPQISLAQVCGNSVLETGEACDDGNVASGDGCSTLCLVEDGFECIQPLPPPIEDVVDDGGFESGSDTYWTFTPAPADPDSPLCKVADCGMGGGSGPHSGEWWAWLGGTLGNNDTAVVEQQVLIAGDDELLTFSFESPLCDSRFDTFAMSIDGVVQFAMDGDDSLCEQAGYQAIVIDLATATGGPFNDDVSHTIRFESNTESRNGGVSNFFVDDVMIDPEPSVCTELPEVCFSEDFDPATGGLPVDWIVFNTGVVPWNWGTTDDGICGSNEGFSGNLTGGTGIAACIDSDAAGPGVVDAYLCSPSVDLETASAPFVDFLYNYQYYQAAGPDDIFDVLVGTAPPDSDSIVGYDTLFSSGGTNRGNLFSAPGEMETLSLSAYIGQAVHICLRYGADFDWYAEIDDVRVQAESCTSVGPKPDDVFISSFEAGEN
jgi:cysteine-rich repeat protein